MTVPPAASMARNADAEKAYGLMRENLVRYQSPFTAAAAGVPPMRQPTAAVCTKCGSPLTPGVKFCGNCGAPV